MELTFRNDIITNIPTCCRVEDYQALARACDNHDWDEVATVMQCLADTISRYTNVPRDLSIVPSASSVIAMGYQNGIVMNGDKDLSCAMGRPVSEAMYGECLQCPEDCPNWASKDCRPEYGELTLEGNIRYKYGADDGELLKALFSL